MSGEMALLWAGLSGYLLAGVLAVVEGVFRRRTGSGLLVLLTLGLVLHSLSLGLRWERLGHGPFVSLFEILSSNLWSFTLAFALFYWRYPRLRDTAALILPVIFLLMGWLLLVRPGDSILPPTYDTLWLYIHIGFGKVATGALLVAAGLAGVVLSRALFGPARLPNLPQSELLDELGYRFVALAFVFHTLMLLAGAVWAQDAWGRFWAWSALETWSVHTWLMMALFLHLRPLFHPPAWVGALLIWAVFLAAFLVFFGVPFLSRAAHQGMV
ncbi:MAG: cytochrome c biogenesis protein CcsA [Magnetococcales bacterium]|nr:cytochrome c biogenesis protein CcsA [Magnetococcales bacterium]